MRATAIESRIEAAEALFEKLVHRNGCFIVTDPSGIRCRVVMAAALVKRQKTGFLAEIDALRSDLLRVAKDHDHTPPLWLRAYAFNPAGYLSTESDAEEALCAAAENLGVTPEDIEGVMGEHGYSALMVF